VTVGERGMLPVEETERAIERRALAAVRAGDGSAFVALIEGNRRSLHAYCWRMLGSIDDADDALQETLLRAWKARSSFEGRALVRTWLRRIATNVCRDMLEHRKRRAAPRDATAGSLKMQVSVDVVDDSPWPPRMSGGLPEPAAPADQEPDSTAVRRETIELAYLAAIQHLPPRQRAVLILRDSLGWSAKETAILLGTSVVSVNSALQRARSTLRTRLADRRLDWAADRAVSHDEQATHKRYVDATERGDAAALTAMLAEGGLRTTRQRTATRRPGRSATGVQERSSRTRSQMSFSIGACRSIRRMDGRPPTP
jgi:RNA polymerase sigma-70 factor (ECF subfamily)